MKYKKFNRQEKIEAVELVNGGMRSTEVAEILGTSDTTISQWLAKDEFNPDKEYVRIREQRKGTGRHPEPKDPFPEGVEMASSRDPQELERENKDLRKKVAYLENKVAYLTALYKIINKNPEDVAKKNDAWQSLKLPKTKTATSDNFVQ